MTAKEFWEYLCVGLDYRFFAGVPCKGLKPLYDKMDAKIMHYIPSIKENVALGLVNGSFMAGNKAAILIDINRLYNLFDWLKSFNIDYNVPVLIIAYREKIDSKITKALINYGIPFRTGKNLKRDLKYITNRIKKDRIPGIVIIDEGVLEL